MAASKRLSVLIKEMKITLGGKEEQLDKAEVFFKDMCVDSVEDMLLLTSQDWEGVDPTIRGRLQLAVNKERKLVKQRAVESDKQSDDGCTLEVYHSKEDGMRHRTDEGNERTDKDNNHDSRPRRLSSLIRQLKKEMTGNRRELDAAQRLLHGMCVDSLEDMMLLNDEDWCQIHPSIRRKLKDAVSNEKVLMDSRTQEGEDYGCTMEVYQTKDDKILLRKSKELLTEEEDDITFIDDKMDAPSIPYSSKILGKSESKPAETLNTKRQSFSKGATSFSDMFATFQSEENDLGDVDFSDDDDLLFETDDLELELCDSGNMEISSSERPEESHCKPSMLTSRGPGELQPQTVGSELKKKILAQEEHIKEIRAEASKASTPSERKKHMLKLEEALVLLETLKSNLRHKNERDRKLNQLKKRIQLQKKIIGACEDELEKKTLHPTKKAEFLRKHEEARTLLVSLEEMLQKSQERRILRSGQEDASAESINKASAASEKKAVKRITDRISGSPKGRAMSPAPSRPLDGSPTPADRQSWKPSTPESTAEISHPSLYLSLLRKREPDAELSLKPEERPFEAMKEFPSPLGIRGILKNSPNYTPASEEEEEFFSDFECDDDEAQAIMEKATKEQQDDQKGKAQRAVRFNL